MLVVVPTLNEVAHIAGCTESLLAGIPQCDLPDVVVADGGSRDGTLAIVEQLSQSFPTLTILHNAKRLQSAGVNLAVRSCAAPHHRVLVRCDAHASYPPGYLHALNRQLEDREAQSVVVPMDSRGTTAFGRASAHVVDTPFGSGGSAHRGGTASGYVDHGHHAAFSLEWFGRLEGYDEAFSHNEDAEFDRRLVEAGGKIWLDASTRIDYVVRPTPAGLMQQYWNYGKGRARTQLKHGARPRLRQLVPAANLVLLTACLLGGLFLSPLALAWPLIYFAALMGLGIQAARALGEATALLAAPLALAIMHNAWGAGYLWGLVRSSLGARLPQPSAAPMRWIGRTQGWINKTLL